MNDLATHVHEGLALAIACMVPIGLAAVVGGTVGGIVASRFGVQDPVLSLVGRTVGVLAVVVGLSSTLGDDLRRFAAKEWSVLESLGRGHGDEDR